MLPCLRRSGSSSFRENRLADFDARRTQRLLAGGRGRLSEIRTCASDLFVDQDDVTAGLGAPGGASDSTDAETTPG